MLPIAIAEGTVKIEFCAHATARIARQIAILKWLSGFISFFLATERRRVS
jgi:hypothetical protein